MSAGGMRTAPVEGRGAESSLTLTLEYKHNTYKLPHKSRLTGQNTGRNPERKRVQEMHKTQAKRRYPMCDDPRSEKGEGVCRKRVCTFSKLFLGSRLSDVIHIV